MRLVRTMVLVGGAYALWKQLNRSPKGRRLIQQGRQNVAGAMHDPRGALDKVGVDAGAISDRGRDLVGAASSHFGSSGHGSTNGNTGTSRSGGGSPSTSAGPSRTVDSGDDDSEGALSAARVDDPSELVATERDLLTVDDGEGHRRRDQTAGDKARSIAAAQVSMRQNGVPPELEE